GEPPGPDPSRWRFALSILCVAMGILSKENAAVAPFLILAADRLVARGRTLWRFHLASMSMLVLCLIVRTAAIGGLNPQGFVSFVDNPIAQLSFVPGRLPALKVLGRYGLLLVFPARLAIDYSYRAILPAASVLEPAVLAGGALLLGWGVAVALTWRRRRDASFALLWIGLAMAPVANLLFP